ncbi:uncharacterized protein LOC122853711 [Aphidius gifuensis]|uniref:uncharacterized protein LOC122853711 n=1 Tax=Aphidius gifuensis TaxID=684658 RepID=UPI001CDD281B|nr:uncharacterized protein LOC122853711 [Aphidius gifuensis]
MMINDNDSYDKDIMVVERINDDCLAEIFTYVPTCERPKIALVCKKWKRALDNSWFHVKKLELTYWRYDEDPNFLKIKYPTVDGQFNFLKSLLYKCGRYLRELDLSVYPQWKIVPVVNEYCPNLVKLRIRIDDIYHEKIDNAFSNLSKLKVLKIIFDKALYGFQPSVPTALINSLINVADTLTDLNMSNWCGGILGKAHFPEEMTSVVFQLKALRRFALAGIECPISLCNYLDNFQTIDGVYDDIFVKKARNSIYKFAHENMEVLDIVGYPINDDSIYNIANNMKRVHTLRMSCKRLTDTGIVTCTKIKNLKHLGFFGFNNATDSSIKLLKNMTHLTTPCSNKITDESAIKVLENSPEMEYFCVENTSITHKFIEKAAEISRTRKRKLEVCVTLERGIEYESPYFTIDYAEKEMIITDQ